MKNLTVKDLKELLNKFDENLPLVIYKEGKGHNHTIKKEDVEIVYSPYFPNDDGAEYGEAQEFLQIGIV